MWQPFWSIVYSVRYYAIKETFVSSRAFFDVIMAQQDVTDYLMATAEPSPVPYDQLPDSIRSRNAWVYGSPVLIILGTLGNLLSAVVMLRPNLRNCTTSVYLVVLAAVDTMALYTGLLRYWIRQLSGTDVRNASVAACRIHIFVLYFVIQFEAWILVCVSLERMAAIFFAHKAKRIFSRRFAACQVAITGIIIAAINSHFFWTYSLVPENEDGTGSDICYVSHARYEHFAGVVWHWVDFCLASLVPFVAMLVINTAIAAKLLHANHVRQVKLNAGSDTKMTSMTAILLCISFMFLLTTAPIALFLSTQDRWYADAKTDEDYARLDLVWASLNLLFYTNNAINFLLYCVSGPRFRRELLGMCRRNRVDPCDAEMSVTVNTRMESMQNRKY